MAKKEKQFVEEITKMEDDFAQWYTDVIVKTDMVDYAPVKGFMVIKPYGFAIWEKIREYVDRRLKETGHKNMYFPILIPESLLNKEEEHVEGFAPEVAWVTQGGNKVLEERLAVRPTSETIICNMYAKWLNSYRQLPFLYNQWNSVVRWEKTTRPFLRTSEFLWHEGHTIHETAKEALDETLMIINMYVDLVEDILAMPVIPGKKSQSEKFAGADDTYTIEAMMKDGKALQSGTSHYLGQNFGKAFNITFSDRNGNLEYPYYTTWAVSTRLIGGLIMVHSDNRGLVLPPKMAPTQVVIVPIAANKDGVMEEANKIFDDLKARRISVEIDDRDNYSPGYKFNDAEMKGIPVRVEIGPRDIENNQALLFRRDELSKSEASLDNIGQTISDLLEDIQSNMLEKARKNRDERIYHAENMDEFVDIIENKHGFAKVMWKDNAENEAKIKELTGATLRVIPFEQEELGETCFYTGEKADYMAIFAKAY
ncbi:proline--tRNA ligase [Peptostreptococcus equinus]|uniref:Proline--tRNA ligase n=1 Tax=Peptostreptococcus equinus TaxID=3003601 RepID=A0ABY7JR39_9FIRM|nr:proline--tRNA ligase [Peptostreptococcus sp. CBA3647]WAW14971.1 proline--tRNA ligase [Peptostreptococcus sp. CBA3647]